MKKKSNNILPKMMKAYLKSTVETFSTKDCRSFLSDPAIQSRSMGIKQYVIEIGYKDNILDALGESINKDIHDLGISKVSKIKSVQIYKIDAGLNFAQIDNLCCKLLIDPITQEYVINKTIDGAASEKHFVIEVWFKKGVTDAVADTVITGVRDLGLQPEQITVHTGAKYIVYGKIQAKEAEAIASKLLANNIVQDYFIGAAEKYE